MAKKAPSKTTKKPRGKVEGVNKSEEIRKISEAVGKDRKSIMEALAAKGITVSYALVSQVMTKGKKKTSKRGRKAGAKPSRKAVAASNIGAGRYKSAIAFAREVGGLDSAAQMIAELQEIRSL